MKPDLKWLVIKGTCAGSGVKTIGPKAFSHPFKPLAIGYYSTGRAIGRLFVDDEPLANAEGDLAAQFGQEGKLVKIPADAQKVYAAEREIKLEVTDLSTASNRISMAILGVQFTGLISAVLPRTAKGKLYWINLYKSVAGSALEIVSAESAFPFMPLALSYQATARAELQLSINGTPLFNQGADLPALFGKNGFVVPIPRDARRIYSGKVPFEASITDLSGSTNVVTVSLLGVQYPGRG